MTFDEAVLDDGDLLERRDRGRLLWSLATAGAQVRRAVAAAGDAGLDRLRAQEPPRALLVCPDAALGDAARLVTRFTAAQAPAVVWHGVELPRWAGAADALLVGSVDGRDPRLVRLVEQATHRGLAQAVVAPVDSPVGVAGAREPVVDVAEDLNARAARWSVLAPLLLATDAMRLASVPAHMLGDVAGALDEVAAGCRPSSDAFTNPAKSLAVELTDALPVVGGVGPTGSVAAAVIAQSLQLLGGVPAVAVGLPEGVAAGAALLRGQSASTARDIFADLGDSNAIRPRLLTVGDDGDPADPAFGARSGAEIALDEVAARSAAASLRRLADQLGLRSSVVDAPDGPPLVRFAGATAFGDFCATYVGLGRGLDPSGDGDAVADTTQGLR